MKKKHFPMFFDISGKRILIVGAGDVAYRRIKKLLDYDVRTTVVSAVIGERIKKLQKMDSDLQMIEEEVAADDFNPEDTCQTEKMSISQNEKFEPESRIQDLIKQSDIVFAATSNASLNSCISDYSKKQGKWVNNASNREECDFFFPALVDLEEITIAIAGDGNDHRKISEVATDIRSFFRSKE